MPKDPRPGTGEIDQTPAIAGGPGPTPPGLDDGTPHPRPAAPEAPPSARAQREAGEIAEREAGPRRADVPGLAGEREGRGTGEDPGEREQERRTRR
jgi:hypothetical protein